MRVIVFLLIGGMIFGKVQDVLTPNHRENQNVDYAVRGMDTLEPNTITALFAGASHVMLGVAPMQIYEDVQVCTYNLSTSGQPVDCSYFLVKRMLKNQKPAVVFLDTSSLFINENSVNSSRRIVLDNLPLDGQKAEMAVAFGSLGNNDGALSIILPLIKFHTRWSQLSKMDFSVPKVQPYYSAGHEIVSFVRPNSNSIATMSGIAETMGKKNQDEIIYNQNGTQGKKEIDTPYYTPQISEYNLEYLLKLKSLCEEAGSDLILVKIPTLSFPMINSNAWTQQKSEIVKELASEYDLPFIDLALDLDKTGVDFTKDTYDNGVHLNISGAEKVTSYFETFLLENYELEQNPNPMWDEMLKKYQKVRKIAHLNLETDFATYISNLADNMDKWDILMAASEEYVSGLKNEKDIVLLGQLGLSLISKADFADSYVAVIKNGAVEYEAYSGRKIDYDTSINNKPVHIQSSGWYTTSNASIKVGGNEYAVNRVGLNIVVVDRETGLVVDSVCFNTRYEEKARTQHIGIYSLLRAYEAAICF